MGYSPVQIRKIIDKIVTKITYEVQMAATEGTMQDVLDEYGITLDEEPVMPVDRHKSKILVLGAVAGRLSDYQMTAKKLGIPSDNVEFVTDYRKMKHFNVSNLRYSWTYSDIIYGPTPHSMEGMGDTSSLLAEIKNHPNDYPRLVQVSANEKLKITISNFRSALTKTRYFEAAY